MHKPEFGNSHPYILQHGSMPLPTCPIGKNFEFCSDQNVKFNNKQITIKSLREPLSWTKRSQLKSEYQSKPKY